MEAQLAAWFSLPGKLQFLGIWAEVGLQKQLLRLYQGVLKYEDAQGRSHWGFGVSGAGPSTGRGLQGEDVANTVLGKMKK